MERAPRNADRREMQLNKYKWAQNNSEFELRHSRREREGGKGQGGRESGWVCIENWKKIPSNFDIIGGIRGSSANIVSDNGLDDRGSISNRGRGFFF
jgi:hypothetical protein